METTGWAAVLAGVGIAVVGALLFLYRSRVQRFWEEEAFGQTRGMPRGPIYRVITYVIGPGMVVAFGVVLFVVGITSLFR